MLLCGSAATLFDDLAGARALRSDADVIIVNAVAEIMEAENLFSLHPEKLGMWRERHTIKFGSTPTTHSGRPRFDGCRLMSTVDHWWPEASSRGSSGWSGAKLAQLMGYDEVILCGVPLDPIHYAKRGPAKNFKSKKMLNYYRAGVEADVAWHAKVRSMSGWTRERLGEPDG